MKKLSVMLLIALSATVLAAGCGKKDEPAADEAANDEATVIEIETEDQEPEVEEEAEETREGMYRSELTNEWTDEALKNQRPVAVMVDNDKNALDHYGLSHADILYELTNSTKNNGITRLMAIVKDYAAVPQIGSMRSVRPSNFTIAPEWNAILCFFGGPFYIDDYAKNDYIDTLDGNGKFNKLPDGTYKRVDNGKAREYTAYGYGDGFVKGIEANGYDVEYNEHYPGKDEENFQHFKFTSETKPVEFTSAQKPQSASKVELAFKLNKPYFEYNEEDKLYYRFEYGGKHIDAETGGQLAFKNLILQDTRYHQYDENGYMAFYTIDTGRDGWYITEGQAIHITWEKTGDTVPTKYYDDEGNEIVLNTGKTFIALIPDDIFENNVIE